MRAFFVIFTLLVLTQEGGLSYAIAGKPNCLREIVNVSTIPRNRVEMRRFLKRIIREYRKGPTDNLHNTRKDLKHVRRMVGEIRENAHELRAYGVDPEITEVAIYTSDFGKMPHMIGKVVDKYGGDGFKAFLDHYKTSIVEGNRIRKELGRGVTDQEWREIVKGIIGHDGPALPDTFWLNYEKLLGRKYPKIQSKEGFVHTWLDRVDQGGLFRTRSGKLDGGIKKISYNTINEKGTPSFENLSNTIREVFGATHESAGRQLNYLEKEVAPHFFENGKYPPMLDAARKKMEAVQKFAKHIRFNSGRDDIVTVVISPTQRVQTHSLDEFWAALEQVPLP